LSGQSEILVGRARWEAAHGKPYFAMALYWDAWESLPEAERTDKGPPILHAALDLCLDYLEQDASETLRVVEALDALAQKTDGRALSIRAVWRSVRARRLWSRGEQDAAWEHALAAERDLLGAISITDYDIESWGALGNLYKRMADWSDEIEDEGRAEHYRKAMLEAYRTGAAKGPDAHQLLSYLEYRAVLDRTAPIVRSDEERDRLDRALRLRRKQFSRGEDIPWAAFDLARGQHYLRPNVPRFLHDLGAAVEDARRAARTASDRWMVEAAVESLRDLFEVGVMLDGLEEGLLLVRRAVIDDAWVAGSWGALGRPDEFLTAELRAAQDRLVQLQNAQVKEGDLRDQLFGYISRAERRWSEEEEDRFHEELTKLKRDIELPAKKGLRVLFRVFGAPAMEWAMTAGVIPAAAPLVAAYATEVVLGRPRRD
jgi:hypothetical protein